MTEQSPLPGQALGRQRVGRRTHYSCPHLSEHFIICSRKKTFNVPSRTLYVAMKSVVSVGIVLR